MMQHYELAPSVWHGRPLVFDWDDATGEISGPAAPEIRRKAAGGTAICHPYAWGYELSKEPLKSKVDMAAIVGWDHKLSSELASFYPQLEDEESPDELFIT